MGVYLSIVSGAIKLLNYISAALQQHHDEMNGVTKQVAADEADNVRMSTNAALIDERNCGLSHGDLVAKLQQQTGADPQVVPFNAPADRS